jgi:peroxiredoxin
MTDDTHDNAAPAPFTGGPDQAAGHAGAAGSTGSTQPPSLPQDAPPPGRRRWIVAAMGALAVALFTVPLLRGPGSDAPAPATSASGSAGTCAASKGKANLDFTLKDVNGADVRLSDYKGKVILLNFWATWCGPCRVEMPEFESLYNQHKDEGFTILAINNAETAAQIQGFRQELGLNFPMLMDESGEIQRLYNIDGYPRTFLLDRNGIIIARQWGPLTVEQIQELVTTALAS